jgi:hypothetical protein
MEFYDFLPFCKTRSKRSIEVIGVEIWTPLPQDVIDITMETSETVTDVTNISCETP